MNIAALKNNKDTSPILIIDKLGVVGEALAQEFSKENLVVLLSENLFSKANSNILHIPFKKRIPEVPDNEYLKIFIVDDGTSVTRESAFSFINKALENNAPLYFIGSIRNVDVEHADDIVKSYNNSKVLLFGDLFDNAIVFDKTSAINKFISSTREEQKIEVGGNGLSLSFPVTFSDTIKLVIKATQLELTQKVILLFSGVPITDIALAKMFKEVKPVVRIEFAKAQKNKKIYIPKGAMHALEKYDLKTRIKTLDLGKFQAKPQAKQKPKEKLKNKLLYLFIIFLFSLFLPLISTYLLLAGGNLFLGQSFKALNNDDVKKAVSYSKYSNYAFDFSAKTEKLLGAELWVLGLGGLEDKILRSITAGKYLSGAGNEISNALLGFEEIHKGISDFPRDSFNSASNLYKNGISDIEKALALENLPNEAGDFFANFGFASDVLSNSPDGVLNFFGFDSEKKYLVLILDNNYAKPIGGTVAEVKVIKVKDGKITSIVNAKADEFQDYEGKPLDIPFFAKRFGGAKSPSFQNSIYKVNFSDNAKDISAFYQTSNSQLLDGVIAIDKKTAGLLAKDNFIGEMKVLGNSINNKNILINTSDENLEKVINSMGWGGGIYDSRINSDNTVNDYFGIIETNLDNKAKNNLISKTVSKKISISTDGNLSSTLTIAVKNNDSVDYKSYMQLLLPTSDVTEIKVNDVVRKIIPAEKDEKIYGSKSFQAQKGLEVDDENENGKDIKGFLLEIPASGVKTISVTYQLPKVNQASFNYSLNVYKQPGISDYQISLDFSKVSGYQIINSPKSFDLAVDKDKNFFIAFSQK